MGLSKRIKDAGEIFRLPQIEIDLMLRETSGNQPFFAEVTREFFRESRRRHRKFMLIGNLTHGVALCRLPESFDEYFMMIEAAGRRNVKKANRLGYEFRRIEYNDHLKEIGEIRRSAPVRQGRLPDEFLSGEVSPCRNPVSNSSCHDYPYFGVLRDGRLAAYMGVLIAGELAIIEHIYGHADLQSDGVVPKLIVGGAEWLMENAPAVKWYGYGSYFGASESLRRFKRKFRFKPYRVQWKLGD